MKIGNSIVNRPIRVMMLGLRGFPQVQGGIETHAENLCPILTKLGCDVTVLTRTGYQLANTGSVWMGVKFESVWAPKSKGLEAIVHTFFGVLYAAIKRPDILHIQAIGPSLLTPLARLLGLRVVVTHHGPDYDRQKWGRLAKIILKMGEKWGAKYAQAIIVISETIAKLVKENYAVESALIPNGVVLQELSKSNVALENYGLTKYKYVLMVSRLVPEKRHLDLINAFNKADIGSWKLVLVGSSDHPDEYSNQVVSQCMDSSNIIATGFLTGEPLKELFTNAGMFVLPSSHEGLPIALLEALGYGLPAIASDIPANLEVGLPEKCYFELGNSEQLTNKIIEISRQPYDEVEREKVRTWVGEKYDWHNIAEQTFKVYQSVLTIEP
mgnify:CR=1 FL=1